MSLARSVVVGFLTSIIKISHQLSEKLHHFDMRRRKSVTELWFGSTGISWYIHDD